MKYIDKNGRPHQSAFGMRMADIRSTNIIKVAKGIPRKIVNKIKEVTHRSSDDPVILDAWVGLELHSLIDAYMSDANNHIDINDIDISDIDIENMDVDDEDFLQDVRNIIELEKESEPERAIEE